MLYFIQVIYIFSKSFLRKSCFLLLLILINSNIVFSNTGRSVLNSNWTNAATWDFGGSSGLPNCGDTINVDSNYTVTVNTQIDYTACGAPMIIYVYGTLQFTNGNKLDLPCGSIVFIMAGGTIKKSTAGGGTSTLISICGVTQWRAGDGPLYGVDTLGVVNLPVELISFEAEKEKSSVKLSWTTASEINNDYFTIEKSSDGFNYIQIALVNGAGTSSFANSYYFIDLNLFNGISYYRLTQIDFDGTKVIFPPIAIRCKEEDRDGIVILQNPFINEIKFSTLQTEPTKIFICLFHLDGKVVFNESRSIKANTLYLIDNLEKLAPGTYFLQFRKNDQIVQTNKVLKQ